MDVRAKQRLCLLACLLNLSGLGGGFALRHLSRSAFPVEFKRPNCSHGLTSKLKSGGVFQFEVFVIFHYFVT
jgi:hypothetical protein